MHEVTLPRSVYSVGPNIDRESSGEMATELHADAHGHHEVDEGHGVECDVPPVHQAAEVHDDQDDDHQVNDAGHKVKAHEYEGDDEDGGQRYSQRSESILPHCQVLFVEDIEDRVGENVDMFVRIGAVVDKLHHVVRQLPGASQGHVVVLACLQDGVEGHHIGGANLHLSVALLQQLDRLSIGCVTS